MKRQFLSFLLLFSLVVSATAQKAQTSGANEKNLRTHVEYLASDKLEGRRTGETGATYAAGYVANIFANYKLKASSNRAANGKANANYLQTFPFVTGVEVGAGNTFSLDVSNNSGQKMTFVEERAFSPVAFSPNAEIGATAVVFVGYGIASSDPKYDDYANQTINGRIVVVFDGTPENDSPHSPFGRFNPQAKALIAKEKGAIAVLLISREAKLDDDRLARMSYDQASGEAAIPTMLVSRKTGADILGTDEAGLKKEEEKLINKSKGATDAGQMTVSKAVVSLKINLNKKSADAYNVVGILEGTDAVLKNEALVIGAHYDHLGRGGAGSLAANSKEIHHGADDNASGVSAMLELARQFSQAKTNKRTLVFIAFGGEEEGLIGSKYYVNNPAFPLNKTVAMINMDMVGRLQNDDKGLGKLTVGGIGTASEWKNLVGLINSRDALLPLSWYSANPLTVSASVRNSLGLKGFKDIIVEATDKGITLRGIVPKGMMAEAIATAMERATVPIKNEMTESDTSEVSASKDIPTNSFNLALNDDGFGPSDHSSFYGKQIPVLFFFTGTHSDYHKPTDTAEKINFAGLLKITDFVAEIVRAVDQNPTKPTYTVAKSSNTTGGRMGFNVYLGTIPNYSETGDGLILDGVRDDSPAAKAGLKAGDKIVKLANREVRNAEQYTFVLGEMKAGVEYEVEIVRGTEKLKLKIVPAARK